MLEGIAGLRLAVIGGDDRDLVLIKELVKKGALIKVAGFLPREELQGAEIAGNIKEAMQGAQAVILPMPGTDETGIIRAVYAKQPLRLTEEALAFLPAGTPVLIGVAKPFLKDWVRRHKLILVETAEIDEVAILNSIPSAEGAIQMAMEALPITIHDSLARVLGFGRVGQTLARMLYALGAHTGVVARKAKDLARGYELGYSTYPFSHLRQALAGADIIFNTVPAMVLTEEILSSLPGSSVVIDLASAPGGTDFQAAARLGIKAILAPGLPGKVAPVTAGKILARVIPSLILKALTANAGEV